MKQTAVEWLVEEFKEKLIGNNLPNWVLDVIQQAKTMEREQIKSAFTKGDLFAEDYFYPEKPNVDCSENYYKQTYESKNKN